MKAIIHCVVAGALIVAFFLVGWYWGVTNKNEAPVKSVAINVPDQGSREQLEQENLRMESEVEALRLDLLKLNKQLAAHSPHPKITYEQGSIGEELSGQLSELSPDEIRELSGKVEAYMDEANEHMERRIEEGGPDYDNLVELYQADPVDHEWAYPREEALHEVFASDSVLQTVGLHSVECRSSLCRVAFSYQDADDVRAASNQLIRNLARGQQDIPSGSVIVRYLDDGEAELYLSDENDLLSLL